MIPYASATTCTAQLITPSMPLRIFWINSFFYRIVFRLVNNGFANLNACNKRNAHEDLFIGICLNKLNVTIVDGADKNGAYRY